MMTVDPAEFFGDEVVQDPYPLYARLREDGGVHRVGDSGSISSPTGLR